MSRLVKEFLKTHEQRQDWLDTLHATRSEYSEPSSELGIALAKFAQKLQSEEVGVNSSLYDGEIYLVYEVRQSTKLAVLRSLNINTREDGETIDRVTFHFIEQYGADGSATFNIISSNGAFDFEYTKDDQLQIRTRDGAIKISSNITEEELNQLDDLNIRVEILEEPISKATGSVEYQRQIITMIAERVIPMLSTYQMQHDFAEALNATFADLDRSIADHRPVPPQ